MRRAFAALALLTTAWPHVVVLECALGSAPAAAPHQHHAAPAHTGSDHDHAMGSVAEDASQGDAPTPCTMVMACGLVMLEAHAAASVAELASSTDVHVFRVPRAPSAVELTADPPPPRRSA